MTGIVDWAASRARMAATPGSMFFRKAASSTGQFVAFWGWIVFCIRM